MKRYLWWAMLAVPVLVVAVGLANKDQWDWLLEDGTPLTVGATAPGLEGLDPPPPPSWKFWSDTPSSKMYPFMFAL